MTRLHGTTNATLADTRVEVGFEAADLALGKASVIVATLLTLGKLNEDLLRNALGSVQDLVREAHLAIAARADR